MAGILNKKQRVMDVLITQEGRRQVAAGELNFRFASFTDGTAFYIGNTGSVAYGANDRLYFEAANRPQDQIIFETDENGVISSFTGADISVMGDKLVSTNRTLVTGSAVVDTAVNLLEIVAQNFQHQYILGTRDIFDDDNSFIISPLSGTFTITNSVPFADSDITEASINDVESLFQDKRMSHLPNFQYLPPVNRKDPGAAVGAPLGNYPKLNQSPVYTYTDLLADLENKESIRMDFSETSLDNNVVAQVIEVRPNGIKKLAIIDFGEFPDEDPYSNGKRVFFLGKIFTDDRGNKTFVNMFTMVFD
ncbi:MAG TPA: hypothetical protein EYG51_21525 [Pseudomonadales bacterium]|nr:hypothetical protein [Pseudomonadales bacterium]